MFGIENAIQGQRKSQRTIGTLSDVKRDLKDPLPAVKGHALIQLEKLVRNGDPAVISCREELFSVVLGTVISFVYPG